MLRGGLLLSVSSLYELRDLSDAGVEIPLDVDAIAPLGLSKAVDACGYLPHVLYQAGEEKVVMTTESRPYERVAAGLRTRIASGEWRPGELIPGRRALAAEYSVAPATLERAAGMLIAEGLLSALDRRGTFVAQRREPAPPTSEERPPVISSARGALQATVGIIAGVVPYGSPELLREQWPAQILAGLEHDLSAERGLTQRFLNLAHKGKEDLTPAQAAGQLLSDGVQAVVVIGHADLQEAIALCEAAGVPLISLEYDPVPFPVPQVYVDSAAGGTLAARHLRERGYHHLTFLRPFATVWTDARLSGARAVTGPDGLRVFPVETTHPVPMVAAEQAKTGFTAGRALLEAGFEPGTGVIAPNDAVAVGFMRAATERGLVPGKDYGMVGFDDRHREAHLTSLRPPLDQMGEEGARLVVRLLRGEASATRVALQHRLIARSSTAR